MKRSLLLSALFACSASLLVSSGCSGLLSSPEYHETSVYDLGFPDVQEKLPFTLTVRPFSSDSSTRYKMLFRNGEQLTPDEFSRWSRTPSEMLTRYCMIAFSGSTDRSAPGTSPEREYVLTGTVLVFETDLNDKISRLYVRCSLSDAGNDSRILWSKTYFIKTPAVLSPDAPGKGAAASMRLAAGTFIRDLSLDLTFFSRSTAAGETHSRTGK